MSKCTDVGTGAVSLSTYSIPKSHKKFRKRQARRYKGQKRQEAGEAKNNKRSPKQEKLVSYVRAQETGVRASPQRVHRLDLTRT